MDAPVNRIKLLRRRDLGRRVLGRRALRNLWRLGARNRRRLTALPTKDVDVGCGKDSSLYGAIGAHGVADLDIGKSDRVAPLAKGRILVRDNGVRRIVDDPGE